MPTIVKTGTDGAKRKQLPQIPQDKIPEFIRYCQTLSYPEQRNPSHGGSSGGNYYNVSKRTDVAAQAVKLPVSALKPTQNEFNADKVKGMMKDVEQFKNDIFIIDQDDHIMDGHHRWAALKAVDPNMLVRAVRVQIPMADLVRAGHDFEGSYTKGIAEMIKLTALVPKVIREHCGHCGEEDVGPVKGGFGTNLEKNTIANTNFRTVIETTKQLQLVLMSLKPGEDIGTEVHPDTTQFIRVERGQGVAVIDDKKWPLRDGDSVVIPAGSQHNIINRGKDDLKLYTVYAPPKHAPATVHKTKADVQQEN